MEQERLLERGLRWLWNKLNSWFVTELTARVTKIAMDVPIVGAILDWDHHQAQRRAQRASNAQERLAAVLNHPPDARTAAHSELTFHQLYSRVRPPGPEWLATELRDVGRRGWQRKFRVRSPSKSSFFQDFNSLDVIPPTLEDERGRLFNVDPSLINVVFVR